MYRRSAALVVATLIMSVSGVVVAASQEEDALFQGCDWLERAIAREPERDDAFGMFMRGMRPKCQAMLEGIARKDNSVRPDAMRQVVKEISELQSVIDAEHGGPPPAIQGPSPADLARQKVAEEKSGRDKVASDKAAADKAEADRIAAEKAAANKAEADRIAVDKAAEDAKRAADREAQQNQASDKKSDAEAKRAAEREARERAAADKKAAEEERKAAAREARERVAADKLAADAAKKTAEEERKAAAREARERGAADKAAAEEAKKAAERERKVVGADAEAERRAAAEREAEAARRIEAEREAAVEREAVEKKPVPKSGGPKNGIDGTWEQPAAKVLDRHVKRTLNLVSKDKKIQGELYEEVWFAAPSAWIDASCGGNDTFRMVTTARVTGEIEGGAVVLSRDAPRILTCTCASRCTVETRRRGMDLKIAASGAELKDATGVFVRPGTAVVAKTADTGSEDPKNVMSATDFAGNWETAPFKQRDRMVVQRLEVSVDKDGKVTGYFVERSTQGLPLASWAERFCEGSDKWEWVTQWKIEGKVSGKRAALKAKDGSNLLCSCPSKCTPPKDKLAFDLVYGATGATLHVGDQVFERR